MATRGAMMYHGCPQMATLFKEAKVVLLNLSRRLKGTDVRMERLMLAVPIAKFPRMALKV